MRLQRAEYLDLMATPPREAAVPRRMQRAEYLESLAVSPREAARILSISTRKLWSMTASGEIPHLKIGRLVRYRAASLEKWLAEREQTGR
jgi:excisionase family DNA binding protein